MQRRSRIVLLGLAPIVLFLRAEQLDDDTPAERRLKNTLIALLKQHGAKD